MLTVLTTTLTLALVAVATLVAVEVAKTTYRNYTRGTAYHSQPFPLRWAMVIAVVEVCWDRPIALHDARMSAVRGAEERRTDAIADCMLRHPSNYAARQASMNAHPSTFGARQAAMSAHPAGGRGATQRLALVTGDAS